MEHVGNLSIPCPLHEQPKDEIISSWHCTMQLYVCLTAELIEESILLASLTHVLLL